MRPKIEAMLAPWIAEQSTKLASDAVGTSEFVGYLDQTLHGEIEGILTSYPPPYLVGAVKAGAIPRVIHTEETDLATVTLEEVTTEFMYSNPDNLFNLSLPEIQWRNPSTFANMSYRSWKVLAMRTAGTFTGPGTEADKFIITRPWADHKREAPTVLAIMIKSKSKSMARVSLKLSVANNSNKNVHFPITEIIENVFSNEKKQAFVFLKIDPTKEGWGDITCEVNSKLGKTAMINTGSSSWGTGTTVTSYSNVGVSTSYSGSNNNISTSNGVGTY